MLVLVGGVCFAAMLDTPTSELTTFRYCGRGLALQQQRYRVLAVTISFCFLKTHNDLFNLHSIEPSSGLDTWAVFALAFDMRVYITMHARS